MAANFNPSIAGSRAGRETTDAGDSFFAFGDANGKSAWITLVALFAGLTFAYWRMLVNTSNEWSQPQYSHGWIVPLIGLYLLWCRRPDQKERPGLGKAIWAVLGGGAAVAAAGYFLGIDMLQGAGLAASILGVLAIGLLHQPFSPMNGDLRVDLGEGMDRFLLGGVVAATAMIAVVYAGLVPLALHKFVLLVALVVYGGTLLGVALASPTGPLARTGAETIAATVAVIGASLIWAYATRIDMMPLMRISYLVTLLALMGLIGGRRLLQWAGPAVAFCVFMYPLPSVVEQNVLPKLQNLAAMVSTTVLQVIGLPVYREGSSIQGLDMPLEVAEACSGLRMSTIFGAMTVAMVFLIRRPWWDKFMILLSAIPVALVVNVIRIVATALIFYVFPENKDLQKFAHDYFGIAMMPVAMGILWLELTILSNLTVEDDGVDYQVAGRGSMPGV